MRRGTVGLAIALTCAWLAGSAAAQDPRPQMARAALARSERAKALREQAEQRAARGDHTGAVAAYQQALHITPSDAASHAGLGRALTRLGRASEAREELSRAVELDPEAADYRVWLGDACRALGHVQCAAQMYLSVLAERPDAQAAAGYDALGYDAFGHAYPLGPDLDDDELLYASERSGLAVAIGFGEQFAGLGAQLDYYFVIEPRAMMLTPFVAYGMQGFSGPEGSAFEHGPTCGVMAMFGPENRWVISAAFGFAGIARLQPYDSLIASRPLYGVSLELGREWMWHGGTFTRLLLGAVGLVDPYHDFEIAPSLAFAFGWKP